MLRVSLWSLRLLVFAALWCANSGTSRAEIQIAPLTDDPDVAVALVSGTFDYDDDFSDLIEMARKRGIVAVTFNSGGGSPLAAMRLGRLIRTLELTTFQVRELECASACTLAFLGGVERIAQPGAIGVHQAYIEGATTDRDRAVADIQTLTGSIMAYFGEMGVDPRLMQIWLSVAANDMRYLTGAEMIDLRVVTTVPDPAPNDRARFAPKREANEDSVTSKPTDLTPSTSSEKPTRAWPETEIVVRPRALPAIPTAYSGRVRYLKGLVPLKSEPTTQSRTVVQLRHGQPLVIKSNQGRWYKVEVQGKQGYLHHSWVLVDQFTPRPLNEFFVQIKSFDNLYDTERYIRDFPIPLKAYLATNGWIAVTLNGTFPSETAHRVLKALLKRDAIPSDSFVTLGNTYAVLVCCGTEP